MSLEYAPERPAAAATADACPEARARVVPWCGIAGLVMGVSFLHIIFPSRKRHRRVTVHNKGARSFPVFQSCASERNTPEFVGLAAKPCGLALRRRRLALRSRRISSQAALQRRVTCMLQFSKRLRPRVSQPHWERAMRFLVSNLYLDVDVT